MSDPDEFISPMLRDEEENLLESSGSEITPLRILRADDVFSKRQHKILKELLRQGPSTPDELSESLEMEKDEVARILDELELMGYLDSEYGGREGYFIRQTKKREQFPSGPEIPLIYHYNLLSDRNRMDPLVESVKEEVDEGDVVADLGAGTGILSHIASEKAEKVYAVESEEKVFKKGKQILEKKNIDNVKYIRGDAKSVEMPEEVDVVICEMLDTGLISEHQIPVTNHAVSNLVEEEAKMIPCRSRTTVRLVEVDYTFAGRSYRLPHYEAYGNEESTRLSEEGQINEVFFRDMNQREIEGEVCVEIENEGIVNAIQLNTYVRFSEEAEEVSGSPWLNPPLNLPLGHDTDVREGDELSVRIRYNSGEGIDSVKYMINNI